VLGRHKHTDKFTDYEGLEVMSVSLLLCEFVWLFIIFISIQTAIASPDSLITTIYISDYLRYALPVSIMQVLPEIISGAPL
jgi:hypothetical protein